MYIYKITNKLNNKSYIGQTIRNPDHRWRAHFHKSNGCRVIASALKKYGKDNFTFEVIYQAFDLKELNRSESFFIDSIDTLAPKGYNLCTGGNNRVPSKETRKLMSLAKKGKPGNNKGYRHTEESKRKISEAQKNRPRHSHTEEYKRKMSSDRQGWNPSWETKIAQWTPVECIELQISFRSIDHAAKFLNVHDSNIHKVLSGKRSSTGTYTFRYPSGKKQKYSDLIKKYKKD